MPDVVVIGGGVGGIAAAARLAKLGHATLLVDRRDAIGGTLRELTRDGFGWSAGPDAITPPAVLRDLFRKSGRPLERYAALTMRETSRRHVFADGSVVDLPAGSRGAQLRTLDAALGEGCGAAWARFVDALGPGWDALRRDVLDRAADGDGLADPSVAAATGATTTAARLLRRQLADPRLRELGAYPARRSGADPATAPALVCLDAYAERTFGVWDAAGGQAGSMLDALRQRLAERGVEVRTGETVTEIVVDGGRVRGARTGGGELLTAHTVICAVHPRAAARLVGRALPGPARRAWTRARPATPPRLTLLGLEGTTPGLPRELVAHGSPVVSVATDGRAPSGHSAWAVRCWAPGSVDVLDVLAARGVDVRDRVRCRWDVEPEEFAAQFGAGAFGLAWAGRRAEAARARAAAPLPGLRLLDAGPLAGASVARAAWAAAGLGAAVGTKRRAAASG